MKVNKLIYPTLIRSLIRLICNTLRIKSICSIIKEYGSTITIFKDIILLMSPKFSNNGNIRDPFYSILKAVSGWLRSLKTHIIEAIKWRGALKSCCWLVSQSVRVSKKKFNSLRKILIIYKNYCRNLQEVRDHPNHKS